MSTLRCRCTFVILATGALCAAHAEPGYHLTHVAIEPAQPNTQLDIVGLNNKGELAVNVTVLGDNGAVTRAFLWRRAAFIELGDLAGGEAAVSQAESINDRSEIVGESLVDDGATFHGFIWRRGEMTDIGTIPGFSHVFAEDLTNRGQIVGNMFDANGDSYPFTWEQGVFTLLDSSPGVAMALNARGDVAGYRYSPEVHAQMWHDGMVTGLGVLPGDLISTAVDINNRGQIIGQSAEVSLFSESGYVWDNGVMTALPPAPGVSTDPRTQARAINQKGDIAGATCRTEPVFDCVATIWRQGAPKNLNDLIHPSDPLKPFVTLQVATRINNRGQIVASGIDSRTLQVAYFLLTGAH